MYHYGKRRQIASYQSSDSVPVISKHLVHKYLQNVWREYGNRCLMFSEGASSLTGRIPFANLFRGDISSMLTHSSVVATLPLDEQEVDENFDFAVIGCLENNVVPHLGDPRLPDEVVMKLGQTLQRGSTVYELEDMVVSGSASSTTPASDPRELGSVSSVVESVDIDTQYPELGSSQSGKTVPRERFSYWCLDLLFSVCSDEHKGIQLVIVVLVQTTHGLLVDHEPWRMRLAALSLPSLLNRCRTTLLAFVADEYLRGSMPFPRFGFLSLAMSYLIIEL